MPIHMAVVCLSPIVKLIAIYIITLLPVLSSLFNPLIQLPCWNKIFSRCLSFSCYREKT